MTKVFSTITETFRESSLQERILSLISHGSSLFTEIPNETKTHRDYDLELILSKNPGKEGEDFLEIMQIIQKIKTSTQKRIELQLRYEDEIRNLEGLIQQTKYKIFMFFAYENGKTLLGKNIYQELVPSIPFEDMIKSLYLHIQISHKDIPKSYLNHQDPYSTNKNIIRTFQDIVLYYKPEYLKKLGTKEMFEKIENAFSADILEIFQNILTENEKMTLQSFPNIYQNNEISLEIIPILYKITRNIQPIGENTNSLKIFPTDRSPINERVQAVRL